MSRPRLPCWAPRRSFRRFHGMGGYQVETPYRFSLLSLRRADAYLWHVPNPPKDGAYAAKCQAHCPLRGAPLPVPLPSGNGYGTQSVQMSWNENHQTGRCVDSIAARPGIYDYRSAEDNRHPLKHDSPSWRKSESTVWQTMPNALLTQADWEDTTRLKLPNTHMGTRTTGTFLPWFGTGLYLRMIWHPPKIREESF